MEKIKIYHAKWRALDFTIDVRPKGLREWLNLIYGWDIFFNGVPFLKTLILANILVWLIFI